MSYDCENFKFIETMLKMLFFHFSTIIIIQKINKISKNIFGEIKTKRSEQSFYNPKKFSQIKNVLNQLIILYARNLKYILGLRLKLLQARRSVAVFT